MRMSNHVLIPLVLTGAASCSDPAKRVFVTSAKHTGDLGGLAGADAKCNTAASGGLLGGTWKAWLSDSTTDAITRTEDVGPWERVDGMVAFNNKANLMATPIVALTINEHGADPSTGACPGAWTGTLVGGMRAPENCSNWASESGDGGFGSIVVADASWTRSSLGGFAFCPVSCSTALHLYCFEQ